MNKNGITNGYKSRRMKLDKYTDIYLYVMSEGFINLVMQ